MNDEGQDQYIDPNVQLVSNVSIELADHLSHLHKKCFSSFWSANQILDLSNTDHVYILLYKNQCKVDANPFANIAAFALFSCVIDTAEVLTLCVDPIKQRKSLGFLLLLNGLALIKAYGISEVFLEVAANNDAALGLYSKLGFIKVGLRKAYYSDGSAAILMKKMV